MGSTVIIRLFVDALIKGAISGPVAPANIVANEASAPIVAKRLRVGSIALILAPKPRTARKLQSIPEASIWECKHDLPADGGSNDSPSYKGGIQVTEYSASLKLHEEVGSDLDSSMGMIASGGINKAIAATNARPPPRPNAADTADVRKLTRHRATKDKIEIPGALVKMS